MLKTNTEEKIKEIKGFALSSIYGNGKVFGQPKGVKSLGFIEVISESGIKGYGEAYCGIYSPSLIKPIVKYLSHFILNEKLENLNFLKNLSTIPFIGNSGIFQSVITGIELAILDLIGKINQKPVHELFDYDLNKKEIECYYSGGSVVFTEDEVLKDIETMSQKGFKSFKMRIGYQDWKNDLKRVKVANDNLQNGNLMVDAIMGTLKNKWDLKTAVSRANDLEKFNLEWLEEPLDPIKLSDYGILCKKSKTPIAMGEAYSGKIHFEIIKKNKYADLIQIDATNSMGFRELLKFSNNCVNNKATHVWGSSLSFIANATLAHLSKNITYHEFPSVEFQISNEILTEKIKIKNGSFQLSEYPGFGIEINENIKNKYRYVKNSGYKI